MNINKIIPKFFNKNSLDGDWVLTIGNFDGFHLGHQALVNRVLQEKTRLRAQGGLVTFNPHPKQVLQPLTPLPKLYGENQKWEICEKTGLDAGFIIPFTRDFSRLSPKQFIDDYLFKFIKIKKLIVGYDFNFGKQRVGSTHILQELVEQNNAEFEKLPPVKYNEIPVSSTMVRQFLFECDFVRAEQFLGRPWGICGVVEDGRKLGRQIGFPTLNIYPEIVLPLPLGVYCCVVNLEGEELPAISNIGMRPTFKGKTVVVETHILNFNHDLYGKKVQIFPKKMLREEITFNSVEELKAQIQSDVTVAKDFFRELSNLFRMFGSKL